MRVFLNPGHAPNGDPDPGALGFGMRECDVAKNIADRVERHLLAAGVETVGNLQSDSLVNVVSSSNESEADIFISIHCNAFNSAAHGTETYHYFESVEGRRLAECINNQIVSSLPITDRGAKPAEPGRNGKYVLTNTHATAVLVETAFIDNAGDNKLLRNNQDDFARAIARGVTDYIGDGDTGTDESDATEAGSAHFSAAELMCHGAVKGHCNCGIETAYKVSPRLLDLLEQLRANIGGPIEISCAYRCPPHNAAEGGEVNSPHLGGYAADVQTPDYPHCDTPEKLLWYCQQLPFDGLGIYPWGVHADVRDGGIYAGYFWDNR